MAFFFLGIAANKVGNGLEAFSVKPEHFLKYTQSTEFDPTMVNKSVAVFRNYFPNHKSGDKLDLNRLEEVKEDFLWQYKKTVMSFIICFVSCCQTEFFSNVR